MEWTIEKIAEEVKKIHSPHEWVEFKSWLSGQYVWLNSQLSEILMRKFAVWNELRKVQKSDTATERVWQATQDGLKETELRLKMKSIDKLISACNSQQKLAEGESKNMF